MVDVFSNLPHKVKRKWGKWNASGGIWRGFDDK
jgi:hypothetical protein